MRSLPRLLRQLLICVLPLVSLSACGLPERGTPIYAKSHGVLPREKVALIIGDVATVDDQHVPNGQRAYEVLPGCHHITTRSNIGASDGNGAMILEQPVGFWATIDMQAGHSYAFAIHMRRLPSDRVTLRLVVDEYFPDGKKNRQYSPGACRPEN